jgi:uncharacterized membrane protein YkoI
MTRRISSTLFPLALTASLALGGCSGTALASWYGDHRAGELAALNAAKTPAGQAVTIAESETGGRAMRIDFEREHDRSLYRIKTLDAGGKVMEVRIDAATGKIAGMRPEGMFRRLTDREDRLAFARLPPSATSLEAAIAAARKDTGGAVQKAAFRDDDGRQAYSVRVAKDERISRVQIDPATGAVVKKSDTDD